MKGERDEFDRSSPGREVVEHGTHHGGLRLGGRGYEEGDAEVTAACGEKPEHLRGRVVAPLGVIDHHHRMGDDRDHPGECVQKTRPGPRLLRRSGDGGKPGKEPARLGEHRLGELLQRCSRERLQQRIVNHSEWDRRYHSRALEYGRSGAAHPLGDGGQDGGGAHAEVGGDPHHAAWSERRDDLPDRLVPVHERQRRSGRRGGNRIPARCGGSGQILFEDRLVQLAGLLEGGDAEFGVQRRHQTAVGVDRAAAVPGPGVEQHGGAIGLLVQRVHADPPPRSLDRPGVVAGRCLGGSETLQHPIGATGRLLGSDARPGFEARGIAHHETGEELAAEQGGGAPHLGKATGTGGGGVMAVEIVGKRRELVDIDRNAVPGHPNRGAIRLDPAASERGPQGGQGAAQARAGPLGVGVGPQQLDQMVPGVLASLDRQVGEQGGRLTRVHHQGRPVDQHLGGSQQR